jgi:uncharacterized membrane protein (DUF485 family)
MTLQLALIMLIGVAVVGSALYLAERLTERRQAAAAERLRLVERVRTDGVVPVGLWFREKLARRILRLEQKETIQALRGERLERRRDEASAQVWRDGKWSAGFVLIALGLAAVWLFLFLLQRNLDIQILQALGYTPGLAVPLGTVIALVIAMAGVLVTGLLGLHPLLPGWIAFRRSLRVTLALTVAVLVLILAFSLTSIAVYRAQNVLGPAVSTQEKILAQARAEQPPDPLQVAVAEQDLADAQARLEKGMNVDRMLAVVVPSAELAIGFAPVYIGELLVVGTLGAAAARAERRARRARNKSARVSQKFREKAASIIFDAGRSPAEVEDLLPGRALPASVTNGPRSLTAGDPGPDEGRVQPEATSPSDDRQDTPRRLTSLSGDHGDDGNPGSDQRPA